MSNRINDRTTIFRSETRTSTTDSSDMPNRNFRGVLVILDVTTLGGSLNLDPKIQAYDPTSDQYIDILVGSSVTTTGTYGLLVYPGAGAAADGVTDVAPFPLPEEWRLRVEHSTGDDGVYTAEAKLLV